MNAEPLEPDTDERTSERVGADDFVEGAVSQGAYPAYGRDGMSDSRRSEAQSAGDPEEMNDVDGLLSLFDEDDSDDSDEWDELDGSDGSDEVNDSDESDEFDSPSEFVAPENSDSPQYPSDAIASDDFAEVGRPDDSGDSVEPEDRDGDVSEDWDAAVDPEDRVTAASEDWDAAFDPEYPRAAVLVDRDDAASVGRDAVDPEDFDDAVDPGDFDDAVDTEDWLAGVAPGERTTAVALDDRTAWIAQDRRTAVLPTDDREDPFVPLTATGALAQDDRTELLAPVNSSVALAPVPTAVPSSATQPATPARTMTLARRRGFAGWSRPMRWLVAASVILLVVIGAVAFAQALAANNQAAVAAAVAELEAAEAAATQPYAPMQAAVADYNDAVLGARASADGASPAFAAVAGMTDESRFASANAALAAVLAQLDDTPLAAPPERYARGDIDLTNLDAIAAATKTANDRAKELTTATEEARAARIELIEKVDALAAARRSLGSSLPKAADRIVDENWRTVWSFKEAVIEAAAAVPAAQKTGIWGDAELLAYAAAVTALREEQERLGGSGRSTPVEPGPEPEPSPDPGADSGTDPGTVPPPAQEEPDEPGTEPEPGQDDPNDVPPDEELGPPDEVADP